MTLSAKWTAVSFLALTAVATGSFAFAGCSVTSSNPTDTEGGTGNPVVDSGKGDAAVAVKCEGNKQTGGDLFSSACQAKLNALCCTELKTCFDIVPTADGGSTPDDCNKYSSCIESCTKKADGTPETDPAKVSTCDDECDTLSTPEVVTAYEAIVKCATDKANADCQ